MQYQQALNLYREPNVQSAFPQESRQGEGNALQRLGNVYLVLSQYDQALEFYGQALEIAREIGVRDLDLGDLKGSRTMVSYYPV